MLFFLRNTNWFGNFRRMQRNIRWFGTIITRTTDYGHPMKSFSIISQNFKLGLINKRIWEIAITHPLLVLSTIPMLSILSSSSSEKSEKYFTNLTPNIWYWWPDLLMIREPFGKTHVTKRYPCFKNSTSTEVSDLIWLPNRILIEWS